MGSKQDQISPEKADLIMGYALEHYLKHYEVVMMKLGHARTATHQSLDELNNSDAKTADDLHEVKSYDRMWEQIIKLFRDSGVSEEELSQIEGVLLRVPNLIRKYYDLLVEQDEILQNLIGELQSEEYQTALKLTRKIQGKPDLMSGLDPSEYDMEKAANAFMFKVPKLRDSLH